MKAVVWHGVGDVRLDDVREPKLKDDTDAIIRVTASECRRFRRQEHAHAADAESDGLDRAEDDRPLPDDVLAQLGDEQALRDAVGGLSPRCRELVAMLFFEDPPRSYVDAARALGMASNSVAFIRARCLQRLRKELEKARAR